MRDSYALFVCSLTGLGGFFFGYDQGVSGGMFVMDNFLEDWCTVDDTAECAASIDEQPSSWLEFQTQFVALLNLGAMVGAASANISADWLGRRATIAIGSLSFVVGTLMQMLVKGRVYPVLYISRFIDGFGIGTSSFILPLYAAEVAPPRLRGLLSGLMQLTVCAGVVAAGLANFAFENYVWGWRYSTGAALLPGLIVFGSAYIVPESPRWLMLHKGRANSEKALRTLRGRDQEEAIEAELQEIEMGIATAGTAVTWHQLLSILCSSKSSSSSSSSGSSSVVSKNRKYLQRMGVVCMMMVCQQLTGVNAVLTYGGVIVNDFGMSPLLALIAIQGTNFLSTVALFAVNGLDNYGRRKLLLLGGLGMCLSLGVCGLIFLLQCGSSSSSSSSSSSDCSALPESYQYAIIVSLCCFIFSFAVSFGPVCWIYPPEVFPTHIRSKAVSLSTLCNWATGYGMSFSLEIFRAIGSGLTFIIFSGCCAGASVFVYFHCPETARRTLEEISFLFQASPARMGPQSFAGTAAPPPVSVEAEAIDIRGGVVSIFHSQAVSSRNPRGTSALSESLLLNEARGQSAGGNLGDDRSAGRPHSFKL